MPDTSKMELPSSPEPEPAKQLIIPKLGAKTHKTRPPKPLPSTSREMKTPKQGYDDDDATEKEEGNVGTVGSPRNVFSTHDTVSVGMASN